LANPAFAALNKCVDDKGRTQYYDKVPPPECLGKVTTEMTNRGRVTKETGGIITPEQRAAKEAEEAKKKEDAQKALDAKRRDKALLNTYANENEIDLARNRNLQPVELGIKSLEPRIASARAKVEGLKKQEADAVKTNSSTLAAIREDLHAAEKNLAKAQKEVADRQQEMENIKARFEADKLRYRELMGTAATEPKK